MTDVSRETMDKLQEFSALLAEWSRTINLVSHADREKIWSRHIMDSYSIAGVKPDADMWCDLGSGAGFPGLVVALRYPQTEVTLIESDRRKAVFLRHVASRIAPNARIRQERIEDAPPQAANVVSARALAPLARLIPMALHHGTPGTHYVFPKGATHLDEIAEARKSYSFDVDVRRSETDKQAVILLLENIERV